MKIGKKVKTVISPKRQVRKFNEKKVDAPVPVSIPKKIPEEVTSWKFMNPWGVRAIAQNLCYTVSS